MVEEEAQSGLNKTTGRIARAAATVMIAFVASNLLGLLAKVLMAREFGASEQLDAFFAANRLPEMLFNLVAGGALGSAFIPTFTSLLTRNDRQGAWKMASAIANLITLILIGGCILAAIFAPFIVRTFLAPGFSEAEQIDLTVALLHVLLPTAIIFGLSGLVMGILNSHQIFLFPAIAPAMYSLGWITGTVLFAPSLGISGLAWGLVLGAGLHLIVQIPALLRLPGRKYSPTLGLREPAVREVGWLMAPRLFGVAIVQLNFVLNTYLATLQPSGSLTGISLAFPLMLMPQAAIAQAAAIAALPTFSAQAALQQWDEMRHSLASTLRVILLLSIPASIGLIILRTPIVALIYQRGAFDSQATELVAWALLWYAVGLVGHCLVEIISRAFYALHDTKTPVFVGAAAMGLNLILSLILANLFTRVGVPPHGGLALANSLATILEAAALLILMRRRLQRIGGTMLWKAVFQAGISVLCMGAVLYGWLALSSTYPSWIVIAGGLLVAISVYFLCLIIFRTDEVFFLVNWFRNKLVTRA